MAIKTEVKAAIPSWPLIMKATFNGTKQPTESVTVLFISHRTGIVLASSGSYPVGYFSESWEMETFEISREVITIQNK